MHTDSLTLEQVPAFLLSLGADIQEMKSKLGCVTERDIERPISVQDATDYIGLENVQTTYRYVREGVIPFHKRGSRLYFFKSELNAWIKGQLQTQG